tara:strand:- start:189 stop:737 length:549 start_codon:yes stop_codon:yes gene_type:complete
MKMLVHRTPAPSGFPFNLDTVKEHVRLDGFENDEEITNMARAAAAELEQFAQIALLTQSIRVTVFDPMPEPGLLLPIGPVLGDDLPTVLIDGTAFTGFDFVPGNRPYLRWYGQYHSLLPRRLVIEYQAGFGASAADVPDDLAHALMDQTALYFDGRSPMAAKSLTTSPHMARIGAKYRGVQT